MKTYKNMGLSFFLITISFLIFSCGGTSIAQYEPKNQDERIIISLLIQYQEAKNNFDVQKLLSFLHDKGKFSFACGRMVSKTRLMELLPELWVAVRSGNSAVIPIVHECINGDYYKSGELSNPQIQFGKDTAEVTVAYANGFCRLPLYFSMCREKGQWLITRTEWGQN